MLPPRPPPPVDPEVIEMEAVLRLTDLSNCDINVDGEPRPIVTFGEVDLDPSESEVLSLRPEYALLPHLSMVEVREAIKIRNTKLRWERDRADRLAEATRAAQEAGESPPEEDPLGRLGFDPTSKLLDLTLLRPTDMKNNRRVIMPPTRPMSEELAISARRTALLRTTEESIRANCDLKGQQVESNLTPSLVAGIKSLRRRIKDH